jgi:hypothetical protein
VRERVDRSLTPTAGSTRTVTRGRGARWPWAIVVIAVGAVKAEAYASAVQHRGALISLFAIGLAASLLRTKPLAIAVFTAGLLAAALALHPIVLGVGFGLGTFVLLIALFFAISTVLHARQRHARD